MATYSLTERVKMKESGKIWASHCVEVSKEHPYIISLSALLGEETGAFETTAVDARASSTEPVRVLVYHVEKAEHVFSEAHASLLEDSLTIPFSSPSKPPTTVTINPSLPTPDTKLLYDSCEKSEPKHYYLISLHDIRLKMKTLEGGSTAGDVVIVLCASPVVDKQVVAIDILASVVPGWSMVKEGKIARVANLFAEGNVYGHALRKFERAKKQLSAAVKDKIKKASFNRSRQVGKKEKRRL